MKKLKRIAFTITVVINVLACVFCLFVPPSTWKYHFRLPKIDARNAGELRMHFLDVGQGDCTVIELPDGKVMLIDGGDGDTSATTVLRYLNALDVDVIDYLLVSHADGDHCGGLAEIVEEKQVRRAFLPTSAPTTNNDYAAFYKALTAQKDCKKDYASRAIALNGTDEWNYTISFLYPYSYDVENETNENGGSNSNNQNNENNENSSVIWLDYQGVSALFTGDAPLETETLLMRDYNLGALDNHKIKLDETEILKVSHHGSKYSTGGEFLDFLHAKTAVISCGEDNTYGHPTEEVLMRLKEREIATYRTDTQGSIVITVSADGRYDVATLGK